MPLSAGTRLALVTKGPEGKYHLALRLLSSAGTTVLAGTEDAAWPFFSPDSRWVAVFADGKLKRIAVDGGTPVVLCDAPDPRGGSWRDDGNIHLRVRKTRSPGARLGRRAVK